MARIILEEHGLKITIEGDGDGPRGIDLYIHAVVRLVEEADTNGWVKATDDYLAADRYRAAVLTALARHYVTDSPMWEEDQRMGVPRLITQLLEEIQFNSPNPFPPLNLGLDDEDDEGEAPSST